MPIDPAPWRRDEFPVTKRFRYLNHAAVSPIPARSAAAGTAMLDLSRDEGAFRIRRWADIGNEARARFARLAGVTPAEVAFVKNTSEGISIVAAGFPWKQGDNVVTTNLEFPSNVYPWMRLRSRGVELRMVPARDGRVAPEELFAACDGKTRLLSLSSVEFGNGFRHDLPRIGEYCQRHGIFFFVDAIQSLGAIPLDARACGIDALAADGHKWLLAPEGIGAMYISRDVMEMVEPVILGWHSVANRFDFEGYDFRLSPDARRYEPGSFNTVGLAAFDASLGLLLEVGVDRVWERVRRLTELAFEEAARAGYEILSSRIPGERSGIVTFRIPGVDAAALWRAVQDRDVVCSPRMDGFDTCRRLRSNFLTRNIPVVMFTSLSDRESRVRALSLGATEFLSKPIDSTELLVRVRNLLKLKKYQDFLEEHGRLLEERVAERTRELREAFIETIERLTLAAEYRDEDTYVHVHRISHYTEVLVRHFDLSPADAELMVYASPMHDIGKVGIPDAILLKKGPLTTEEFEVIKGHTTIGARILSQSKSPFLRAAEKFALYHHERWDGTGYPLGLAGDAIPLEGRILNILDQYDALRSRRPYKPAMTHEEAMEVLTKGDGRTHPGHFDPVVYARFVESQERIQEIYERHAQAG